MSQTGTGGKINHREYHRRRLDAERPLMTGLNRLGRSLHQLEGTVKEKARHPDVKPMIQEMIRNVREQYPIYRDWRLAEGKPMTGDYQELRAKNNKPRHRLNLAVKELGHRMHQDDRDGAKKALTDVLIEAEETHIWECNRAKMIAQEKKRLKEKAEAEAAATPATTGTADPA